MKLKGLNPRLYNIVFHTHTVSGIVIGFALFICFYAGAFALFMDEMYKWENPEARFDNVENVDFDKVFLTMKDYEENFAVNEPFSILPPSEHDPYVWFYGSRNITDSTTERFSAYVHPATYEVTPFEEPKTHMGRTIYELHFFHQIPIVGIRLAGFVGFFFLFAIISGVLIHWRNIMTKLYAFTTEGKWKQIWTNSHTVLGFIALPFQFIYAVTGALLGLSIFLLAPSAYLLFDGDTNEIIKAVRPDLGRTYADDAENLATPYYFNSVYDRINTDYPDHKVKVMFTNNYGKEDGTISVRIDDQEGLMGDGDFMFSSKDGSLLHETTPYQKSYAEGAYPLMIKLHYATYGGLFLKIIYFILAMMTCYVISSGVMIWKTARNMAKYTDKQKRFHHRVTKTYLALTQGLFPAIALIFLANKWVPMELADRTLYVNSIFFLGWLGLAILGLFWNNYKQLNINYLLIGGVMGLLVPISNGIVTGDWIWTSWMTEQYEVFSVDLSWIFAAATALFLSLWVLPRRPEKEEVKSAKPKKASLPKRKIPVKALAFKSK
ncbi:MAG: PepSY-associated TM helix domain-containing protein [Bacteroidota bacterium]